MTGRTRVRQKWRYDTRKQKQTGTKPDTVANDQAVASLLKSLNGTPGQIYSAGIYNQTELFKVIDYNPGYLFNITRGKLGGALGVQVTNGTVSIAAENTQRVESLSTISATVIALSSDTEQYPRFVALIDKTTWRSTGGPFIVSPFIARLENGETLTATNANTADVPTTVIGACGNQDKVISYGPMYISHQDPATGYWSCEMTFDLQALANLYSKYYSQKELDEEDAAVLLFGFCITGTASQSIYVHHQQVNLYYQQDRSMKW